MSVDDIQARLNAFVEEVGDPRKTGWADKLPQEVQAVILASTHSSQQIASWLLKEGYEGATYAKVDSWRRKKLGAGRERAAKP